MYMFKSRSATDSLRVGPVVMEILALFTKSDH